MSAHKPGFDPNCPACSETTFVCRIFKAGREDKPVRMYGYTWSELIEVLQNYQSTAKNPVVKIEIERETPLLEKLGSGRPITLRLTEQEHATILAGLRYWQQRNAGSFFGPTIQDLDDVATNCGEVKPMTVAEIDELCGRINP